MIQTRISWTPEALDEAIQAAPDCDTGFELAEVLSQRWGCKVTRKSVVRAFERAGLRVGDYLGTGDNTGPFVRSVGQSEAPADEALLAVVRAVQRGASDLEAICNEFDVSPRRAREMIGAAIDAGYDLEISDEGLSFCDRPQEPQALIDSHDPADCTEADPVRFAVISDTHFGGPKMATAELHHFIRLAYSRGYRRILHAGDMFDGSYHRGQQYEIAYAGFERQSEQALAGLIPLPGLRYFYIIGNHDYDTYHKACGLDPGRALADRAQAMGRDDIHYIGAVAGRVHIGDAENGIKVELSHRKINAAYARSWPVQKYVEKYVGGDKPDVLILGHLHSYSVNDIRNIICLQTGSFHWKTHFEQEKGLTPSVGGFMVDIWRDSQGLQVNHYYQKYWPEPVSWRDIE